MYPEHVMTLQEKYQCHGITKAGRRCKITVSKGAVYCQYHAPISLPPKPTRNDNATLEQKTQCQGTTKAGDKCHRLASKNVGYCHWHAPKSTLNTSILSPTKSTKNENLPDRGFIYIYTLAHLLSPSPTKQEWLLHSKESKDAQPFDPQKQILIKVGLTRGSVNKRLRQWEAQCSHKLVSVNPYMIKEKKVSLTTLMNKLSIRDREPELSNYDSDDQGFWCSKGLVELEKKVHTELRSKYGRGDMICHGCSKLNSDGEVVRVGLHVEWFKVPRRDLKKIFEMIDRMIL